MLAAMGEVTVASDRDAWSVQDDGAEVTRGPTLAEAVELAQLLVVATKAAGGRSNFDARSDDEGDLRKD